MKFSLLQKKEDRPAVCEVIYDLSVDRAAHNIIEDTRRADYFVSVLSKPLTDRDNIIFRQQIFSDFQNIPGLFDSLRLLFARYDRIKSDWQEMKLGTATGRGAEINPEALLEYTFSSLKGHRDIPCNDSVFLFLDRRYPLRVPDNGGGACRNARLVPRNGGQCRT